MHVHGLCVSSTSSFVLSRCPRNSVVGYAIKDNLLILNFFVPIICFGKYFILKEFYFTQFNYIKEHFRSDDLFLASIIFRDVSIGSHNTLTIAQFTNCLTMREKSQNLESVREIFE